MEGPLQAIPGPGHPSAKEETIKEETIYTASPPPGEYQTGENLGGREETASSYMIHMRGACSYQGAMK